MGVKTNTKTIQAALAHPERSWLRKMSVNTMIRSQIMTKNMKNHSIDHSSWPVPNSYVPSISSPRPIGWCVGHSRFIGSSRRAFRSRVPRMLD